MKIPDILLKKIYTLPELAAQVAVWRVLDKKIAFTNGCFDIFHEGHLYSLSQAAETADYLIVGVNSDEGVKKLKGEERPINNQSIRTKLLANLSMVDAVILFNEPTPAKIITAILPDILVKGGDYTIEQIVGAEEVLKNGGKVIINPIIQGYSTTAILEKIKQL